MILKIYKNKSTFIGDHHIGNYYFLKNNDNDSKGVHGTTLKSVISKYKGQINFNAAENSFVEIYFELINCKEYNTFDELEFDYLEELI